MRLDSIKKSYIVKHGLEKKKNSCKIIILLLLLLLAKQ